MKRLIVSVTFLMMNYAESFAQISDSTSSPGTHVAIPSFGEFSGGAISISEHLNDSLLFTDPWFNERYRIASFNLALKCNGNVVKYLENKSGNKLTPEMKEAVLKLHSNCAISFDGIKMVTKEKDMKGKLAETKLKSFQLKIK